MRDEYKTSLSGTIAVHRMVETAVKAGLIRAWWRYSTSESDGLGDLVLSKNNGSIVRCDLKNAEIVLGDMLADAIMPNGDLHAS